MCLTPTARLRCTSHTSNAVANGHSQPVAAALTRQVQLILTTSLYQLCPMVQVPIWVPGELFAPFPRPTLQARHHQARLGVKFGDEVRVRVIRSMSAHPMLLLSRLKSSVPLTVASWVDLHPRLSHLLKISVCQ